MRFYFARHQSNLAVIALLILATSLTPLAAQSARAANVVVGDGTPASCTDSAWDTAITNAASGSTITFNCGSSPLTISVTTKVIDKALSVEGGGKITLDGGGTLQLFLVLNNGDLSLQDIKLVNGNFGNGGAIYNQGKVTLTRVTIQDSKADGGRGGAIYNQNTLAITDSDLTNNSASLEGGGIWNAGGAVNVSGTQFYNNRSINGGGYGQNGGAATIQRSLFVGNGYNSAVNGGGVYNEAGTVNLTNVTMAGNFSQSGGHIYSLGSTNLLNSTLSIGRADNGGALFLGGGSTHFKNTILSISQSLDGSYLSTLCDGYAPASDGYNLAYNQGGIRNCYLNSAGDKDNMDPQLSPLQDNGGLFLTLLPLAGSPAIDGGTNTGCPAQDARGVTRPQGSICDIGAIEVTSGPVYNHWIYLPLATK